MKSGTVEGGELVHLVVKNVMAFNLWIKYGLADNRMRWVHHQ